MELEHTAGHQHHHHGSHSHHTHHQHSHEHVHSAECGCINVHEADLCGRGLCNHVEHMRAAMEQAENNLLAVLSEKTADDSGVDQFGRKKKDKKSSKRRRYEARQKEAPKNLGGILLGNFSKMEKAA